MTLYHYTSLENLPLIVRKDGNLEFLLTDYMDFDDPSEGKKMWEVIREVDKKWVEDIWERFVISFCIENDNLAMLKEYANNASGVVLAINSNYLDKGTLFQCRYDLSIVNHIKDRILRIKEDFKDRDKETDWRANTQERAYIKREMAKLLAIKDPHYNYEQEWRLRMSGRMENVVFQFKRGRLRQRYPLIVDIKALEKIYVGPNNNPSVIDEIKTYLRYTTIPKMEVEMLKVPYRSR